MACEISRSGWAWQHFDDGMVYTQEPICRWRDAKIRALFWCRKFGNGAHKCAAQVRHLRRPGARALAAGVVHAPVHHQGVASHVVAGCRRKINRGCRPVPMMAIPPGRYVLSNRRLRRPGSCRAVFPAPGSDGGAKTPPEPERQRARARETQQFGQFGECAVAVADLAQREF